MLLGYPTLHWNLDPQQDVDDMIDRVLDQALWRLESHYDLHQTGLQLGAILADRRAMWAPEKPV